ncbi:MAG: hypothetical protein J7496_08505 [Novosphingobium sp.]|nr:hypothetical protein [Novosphingobium sp.]
MKLQLIEGWRHAWRFWSVRLNGAALTILSGITIVSDTWNSMPQDLRAYLPYAQGVSLVLFAAGLIARFVSQPKAQAKIEEAKNAG